MSKHDRVFFHKKGNNVPDMTNTAYVSLVMNGLKAFFRHVAFVMFLCFVPSFVYAQSLLIDVPNVSKDNANHSLSKAVRTTLSEGGFTVSDESEMRSAAQQAGISEDYWKSPDSIVQMNKSRNHDALIVIVLHPNKKPYMATTIYEASTGKILAEFKTKLQKKTRLSKAEKSAFLEQINKSLKDIEPSSYSNHHSSENSGSAQNDLSENTNKDASANREKLKNGTGRPVFMIAVNINPAFRNFKFNDDTNLPLSYKTIGFPVFGADFVFFPFPLFSSVDYLQGLGIQVGFGIARPGLNTNFKYKKDANFDTKCQLNDDFTYTCKTTEYKVHADLIYRLLLNKSDDGKLDPNGMALDFIAGFNMMRHLIDENPAYNGNDYYGLRAGLGFSTPLGISSVRLSLNALFVYNFNKEDEIRTKRLGNDRGSSLGVMGGAEMLFDIYKGFFIHAGYDMLFIHSGYNGNGCHTSECKRPSNASINDLYHEVVFGLGYMYY